ncbi:hypothetical protein PO124_16890 [Bacillus licheniformis]|nr:hypothetical protein [Bacillus licheniformis]
MIEASLLADPEYGVNFCFQYGRWPMSRREERDSPYFETKNAGIRKIAIPASLTAFWESSNRSCLAST